MRVGQRDGGPAIVGGGGRREKDAHSRGTAGEDAEAGGRRGDDGWSGVHTAAAQGDGIIRRDGIIAVDLQGDTAVPAGGGGKGDAQGGAGMDRKGGRGPGGVQIEIRGLSTDDTDVGEIERNDAGISQREGP